MLLVELIRAFLEYVEHERGSLCPKNYERDLKRFARFAFENANFNNSGFSFLEHMNSTSYLRTYLAQQMLTHDRKTVARSLGTLKVFFRFLELQGYIKHNAARLIQFPKALPDKLPPHLNESEAAQVTELEVTTPKELRARAIVELLYSTGIRASELQRLNFRDLNFGTKAALIKGKGGIERLIFFGTKAEAALLAYLESLPGRYPQRGSYPVFRNGRRRLSLRAIQRIVKSHAIEALGEPGRRVTPLALRHSCATHLMNAGARLEHIRDLLGHKSVRTTQKYTHVSRERLKEVYRAAHPREQFKGEFYDEEGRFISALPVSG